jgi:hypothetical protein
VKCSLLTLSCYVDAELPAPRKGELEAHLVGCHRCRAGLGHLREEVERIEGLARVHLPESSVRLLLEHTGLIAAGDPMPAVPDAAAVAEPTSTTPPWLRGGAGAALPWASARPASPPRYPPGAVPAPGGPVAPPPPPPSSAPDTFDVWAAARMEPPPGGPAVADPAPAEMAPHPPEPPRESRSARRRARAAARREAAEAATAAAAAAAAEAEAVEPTAAEASAEPTAPKASSEPTAVEAASEPALVDPAAEAEQAPPLPPFTTVPTSSISDPETPGHAEIAAAAVPPGGDAVPVWTPESSAETPPVPRYPLTDEDALEEPTTVERFGPMPAPRPGMVDRLRERLALRRALRVAALDDRDDGIEIVSGPGAPMRGPRSRADLARRRSEALRPAGRPDATSRDGEEGASPASQQRTGRREPTVDELLPPPARPSGLTGAAAPPARPAPTASEEEPEEWTPWQPAEPPSAGTRTVDGRRLTVVLGAAILLMFVVGVASARSTSPLPATSSSSPQAQAPAVSLPRHEAVAPPAGPSAPVAPAPHSAAALPGLTGSVTVGDGAPGWSVQDIRYGAHAGYLRMVLDLVPAAGAASGSPRVTIGFQDPTTMIVSLDQVTAHGAPPAPLAGGLVTSISLLTPAPAAGSTAYVVKLAHPVQFTPAFATSPLRLILDLH